VGCARPHHDSSHNVYYVKLRKDVIERRCRVSVFMAARHESREPFPDKILQGLMRVFDVNDRPDMRDHGKSVRH
jgi:hypothetical protein